MTVRIETKLLVGVLTDLLQTAAADAALGAIHGVLVHTTRGEHGDEPGRVELFAGISTTGSVAGHTYAPCSGQLCTDPLLWDRDDTLALVAVLRPLAKKPMHAVELRLEDEHVVVAEDPDLFGEGLTLTLPTKDAGDFPGQSLYRLIQARQDGLVADAETAEVIEPERRTDFAPARLSPFLQVAKRRGEPLQLFRAHQSQPVAVQVGPAYRGVCVPLQYQPGGGDESDAEVWAPDFPPEGDLPDLGPGVTVEFVPAQSTGAQSDDPETEPAP